MANPKVRPHLSFYPEDYGPKLNEARQAHRWLHELPDDQMTPMARIREHDYFIHEPAMLRDGRCCVPTRWFTRGQLLFAECWELRSVITADTTGWRVIQHKGFEVAETEFLKNFVDFRNDAISLYNLPSPTNIIGELG